ncbi:pheromone processing carboxypeptidase-like protein Kex1 [Trichodelitschia bisporula]|uniref:Carboxypeptidase n=1 Tax=Trichodelitschia bisporula TaxID=703511 RepID=A0A6G1HTX5_9PEZI|nr:pheromone processing carboxypeptidase-like protein Kex1 [Trichodelitschia bisporula]
MALPIQPTSRWRWGLAWMVFGLMASLSPVMADKTSADYFVSSLPGAPGGPLLKMHAGHIEITPEHHGNLFFWHFQNRHLADRPRTVIWLNGGPGCSSEDGAMMEIGPYRVRKGGKLELIDGSWDEFANLLFVDNPVGTGFSYVDTDSYVSELDEMASQFVQFLEKWFSIFPEYKMDDIYLAGESYAGQHIPYIARAILDRNKGHQADSWNLQGLIIGNGWISGVHQYPSYLQYAYEHGLVKAGTEEATQIERQQLLCQEELSKGGKDHVDVSACEDILQEILVATSTKKGDTQMCLNMYDVRLRDEYPSCGMNWPPDLPDVTSYLRRRDVIDALHVNPDKRTGWMECNGAVGSAFNARDSKPSYQLLSGLLAEVPIILFSGDQDLICNHIGTEELIHDLEFNGGKGFEISPGVWAPRRAWEFEGEPAGIYQEARNLTYIKFYNSSHMVPFDYPRRSRDMLDRFMGVDIASIGGIPTDSRIDGEKGPQTSVGGHTNSTAAEKEQSTKLQEATWRAYAKSGEMALVVVIIAVCIWAYFVWRARRKHGGYTGLPGLVPDGREGFRHKRVTVPDRDLEAADFDENELDDLAEGSAAKRGRNEDMYRERYSVGEASESEEEEAEEEDEGKRPRK